MGVEVAGSFSVVVRPRLRAGEDYTLATKSSRTLYHLEGDVREDEVVEVVDVKMCASETRLN